MGDKKACFLMEKKELFIYFFERRREIYYHP